MLQSDLFGNPPPNVPDAVINRNGVFTRNILVRSYVASDGTMASLRFARLEGMWRFAYAIQLALEGVSSKPSLKGPAFSTFDEAEEAAKMRVLEYLSKVGKRGRALRQVVQGSCYQERVE